MLRQRDIATATTPNPKETRVQMSRPAHQILNLIASAAALIMLSSGELRPAGVRTAFEMLGGVKARIVAVEKVANSE